MPRTRLSLIERFQRYFSIQLARTAAQKSAVYGIRYRVYCEQFRFEPIDAFPNREESDAFDERALHCLVVHNRTQQPAACVRLVPACGDTTTDPLPIERIFRDTLDNQLIDSLALERDKVCEISRLAVDLAFRRRSGEANSRVGEPEAARYASHERSTFPFISMAAFLGATALTEIANRTDVFAMMEPFLARMLARSGIIFERVGGDLDYHGIRAPYFTTTQRALDNMTPDTRAMYLVIAKRLRAQYELEE